MLVSASVKQSARRARPVRSVVNSLSKRAAKLITALSLGGNAETVQLGVYAFQKINHIARLWEEPSTKYCNNDVANSKALNLSYKCNKETESRGVSANWCVLTDCAVPAIKALPRLICKTNWWLLPATSKDGCRSSSKRLLRPTAKCTHHIRDVLPPKKRTRECMDFLVSFGWAASRRLGYGQGRNPA